MSLRHVHPTKSLHVFLLCPVITVMSGSSTHIFLGFQFPCSLLSVCVLVGKTSGLDRCELRFTGPCEQTFELLERSNGKLVNSLSELILLYLRLRKQRQGWRRGSGCESPASRRRSWSRGITSAICGAKSGTGSVLDSAGTSQPKHCVCVVLTPQCVLSHQQQAFTGNPVSQFSTVFGVRHNGTWYRPEMGSVTTGWRSHMLTEIGSVRFIIAVLQKVQDSVQNSKSTLLQNVVISGGWIITPAPNSTVYIFW